MGEITQTVFQSTHLKSLNMSVPWIALGTAEVESVRPCSEEELTEVIYTSFERGIRVVDTASNYYAGKAEECIGRVISSLNRRGRSRDIIVFTKAGQLTNDEMQERDLCGKGIESQYCCFEPDYLEMSIKRSQERLGLKQLDCVFLHNPEDGQSDDKTKVTDVLLDAIPVFEKLCSEGVLKCWGIASWSGFYRKYGDPKSIQLMEICQYLDREYKEHHFAAIQCPFGMWNWEEFNRNSQFGIAGSSGNVSVKKATEVLGLDLLINSPFCGGVHLPTSSIENSTISAAQHELTEIHSLLPQTIRVIGMRSSRSLMEAVCLLETIHE